jgi:hypothetical protein
MYQRAKIGLESMETFSAYSAAKAFADGSAANSPRLYL